MYGIWQILLPRAIYNYLIFLYNWTISALLKDPAVADRWCEDWNSQPPDQKSDVLTTELPPTDQLTNLNQSNKQNSTSRVWGPL